MKQLYRTKKSRRYLLSGILLLWTSVLSLLAETIKPRNENLELPKVFQDQPAKERLKALRVAEMDATRALAERLYGFQLNSGATILDFMIASDTISNGMQALLKGASQVRDPTYSKEGIVEVIYGVNLRTVMEEIKAEADSSSGENLKQLYGKSTIVEDTLIEARGNGALPNSKGLSMIRAKRAAELDAYRKMAERFVGVKIDSNTTVSDMCLQSDSMLASATAFLKGLKPVDIVYRPNGACEVSMQLKVRDIIETVETMVKQYRKRFKVKKEEIRKVNHEIHDRLFVVTGYGAPKDEVKRTSGSISPDEAYKIEQGIIRRIISQETIVD